MDFWSFIKDYSKHLLFVAICLLPLSGKCLTEEVIVDKRNRVAMRTIGHEVLLCLGDSTSRILPIEKLNEQYKISFESELGFDPKDLASIVDRVMTESRVATNYLVEVEQCSTKEVMHSFEIRNAVHTDQIACKGRVLPKDCYSLIISILGESNRIDSLASSSFITTLNVKESNLFRTPYLLVLLFLAIGFMGYIIKKRNVGHGDPDLIRIGASKFDEKNMALSYEGEMVELSNKESELLSLLYKSANLPIEREVILRRVWGDEGGYVGRTLDVFISKLRKKLERDESVKIVNIRGVGYKLIVPT